MMTRQQPQGQIPLPQLGSSTTNSKIQEEQEHFYSSDDFGDEIELKKVKFSENTTSKDLTKAPEKLYVLSLLM